MNSEGEHNLLWNARYKPETGRKPIPASTSPRFPSPVTTVFATLTFLRCACCFVFLQSTDLHRNPGRPAHLFLSSSKAKKIFYWTEQSSLASWITDIRKKLITGSHKNIQGYLMELKYFWHRNQEAFQHLPEFAKILEKVLSKQIYPWDHCFMMYISPVSHKTTCQDRSNAAGTAEQSPTHTRGCPPVPFIPGVTARVRSHSSHLSTELFLLLKPKEGVQVNTKRFIGFPCIKGTFFLHSTNFIPS